MRIVAIVITGIALLLTAVAALAPATLVDRRLAAATAGRLRIADAAGTVWNGRGLLTDATNTWRVPLAWTVSTGALIRGALQVAVTPAGGGETPHGTIDLTSDTASLREFVFDVPAATLAGALPPRSAVTLGGSVSLESPSFDWNGQNGAGTLNARWRGARLVAAGAVADLGTVDVTLAPQDQRVVGHIGNTGGDVRIDGTIAIAGGTASIDAAVTPAASAPAHIASALAALGTPDGGGTVRIAWRGSLR